MVDYLIERLTAATGPSRELDCLIAIAADARPAVFRADNLPMHYDEGARVVRVGPGYGPCFDPLQYTASIDAAVTLVPEGWQWQASNRAPSPKTGRAYIHNKEPLNTGISGMRRNPKYQGHEVTAATPAIAICMVALRARG